MNKDGNRTFFKYVHTDEMDKRIPLFCFDTKIMIRIGTKSFPHDSTKLPALSNMRNSTAEASWNSLHVEPAKR